MSARLIPIRQRGATAAAPLRPQIEAAIERLLAVLDTIDDDVDLEPSNDDEPSLGWPEGNVSRFSGSVSDLEEDYSDSEPSLAEPENPEGSQARWGRSRRGDGEQDAGDEGEPDEDSEHWRQPLCLGDNATGAEGGMISADNSRE